MRVDMTILRNGKLDSLAESRSIDPSFAGSNIHLGGSGFDEIIKNLGELEVELEKATKSLEDATTGPNPMINLRSLSAGLVLALMSMAVLSYLMYVRSQTSKKSWVNASVNLDGTHVLRFDLIYNIIMYCLCSSLLLVINKVTVQFVPLPGFVLFAQMAATAVFVKFMEYGNGAEVDRFEKRKVVSFIPIVLGFVSMLFSTMKALQYVPVDTFICARASTPTIIAVVEYMFLGRALPSMRSWAALGGLLLGVFFYVKFDYHFTPEGYMWIGIWYVAAIAEMIIVKHVCTTVKMTTWGRTYYMNSIALVPMTAIGLSTGELLSFGDVQWTSAGVGILLLSCLAGVGMSYYSFSLRAMIAATSFSLIGNVCKVITILVNIVIWDKHAGLIGTFALLLCLVSSTFYQQAPMRISPPSRQLP